jgi:hypothetical protein
MTASTSAQAPLEIHRIQSSRSAAGEIRLRLSGRWLDPQATGDAGEELLVVQVEGRRHRFPASRDDEGSTKLPPGHWSASFIVPTWAEPRLDGQAAVWLGDAVIPVPPLHGRYGGLPTPAGGDPVPTVESDPSSLPAPLPAPAAPPPPGAPLPSAAPPMPSAAPLPSAGPPMPSTGASDAPRSGPLADLLLRETVAALHAELEQRTADAAHMRGALADSQSDFEARTAMQAHLETTLGELRGELKRLMEAVESQRGQFAERTAEAEREFAERTAEAEREVAERTAEAEREVAERTAEAEREFAERAAEAEREFAERAATAEREFAERAATAERERAELERDRAELERRLAELLSARGQSEAEATAIRGELAAARANFDRRAAETTTLREDLAAASVSREAAISEAAGLRAELGRLGSELAVTRERVGSESGDLGEANRLLADAKALAAQLRGSSDDG